MPSLQTLSPALPQVRSGARPSRRCLVNRWLGVRVPSPALAPDLAVDPLVADTCDLARPPKEEPNHSLWLRERMLARVAHAVVPGWGRSLCGGAGGSGRVRGPPARRHPAEVLPVVVYECASVDEIGVVTVVEAPTHTGMNEGSWSGATTLPSCEEPGDGVPMPGAGGFVVREPDEAVARWLMGCVQSESCA